MKQITSTHNAVYKNIRQLASSSKHRKRTNQTLLEGIHLCKSYLEQTGKPLLCVYTDPAITNAEVADIVAQCEKLSVPTILLGESNFQAVSSVENGVGIMFVASIPTPTRPAILNQNALLLENIQDPGNMGTILRTAGAAGIEHIYTSTGSSSAWSPKVLRAGMGAHFVLNIYENCRLSEVINSAEVQVLATSLDADASVYEKDLSVPTAWLFGNEGRGVSDELLSLNVEKVIIPQNSNVESLNVAASTAVCLFEQVRQNNNLEGQR